VSAYVASVEDKITIPYVPSHLHHMMFELMKVTVFFALVLERV